MIIFNKLIFIKEYSGFLDLFVLGKIVCLEVVKLFFFCFFDCWVYVMLFDFFLFL